MSGLHLNFRRADRQVASSPASRDRADGRPRPIGKSTDHEAPAKLRLRRATVLKFFCPACPAKPGQPCVIEGTGEVRSKLHRDRVEKAERLIAAVLRQHGKLPAAE